MCRVSAPTLDADDREDNNQADEQQTDCRSENGLSDVEAVSYPEPLAEMVEERPPLHRSDLGQRATPRQVEAVDHDERLVRPCRVELVREGERLDELMHGELAGLERGTQRPHRAVSGGPLRSAAHHPANGRRHRAACGGCDDDRGASDLEREQLPDLTRLEHHVRRLWGCWPCVCRSDDPRGGLGVRKAESQLK